MAEREEELKSLLMKVKEESLLKSWLKTQHSENAEEPEIKLPTSVGSLKKQKSSRKTSTSALLTMPKPLTV